MVVFLDLEDEAVEPPDQQREYWLRIQRVDPGVLKGLNINEKGPEMERENPNREKAITRALGCYPYVSLDSFLRHPDFTRSIALWNCKLIYYMAESSLR